MTITPAQWVELGLNPRRHTYFFQNPTRSHIRVFEGRHDPQTPFAVQMYDPDHSVRPITLGHFRDHAQALQVATILELVRTDGHQSL